MLKRKHGKDGFFVDSWIQNLYHYLTKLWNIKFSAHGHIAEFCRENIIAVNILHIMCKHNVKILNKWTPNSAKVHKVIFQKATEIRAQRELTDTLIHIKPNASPGMICLILYQSES